VKKLCARLLVRGRAGKGGVRVTSPTAVSFPVMRDNGTVSKILTGDVIEELRKLRAEVQPLGELTIRQLIEEGRRYR
jgi:hypothetical protein